MTIDTCTAFARIDAAYASHARSYRDLCDAFEYPRPGKRVAASDVREAGRLMSVLGDIRERHLLGTSDED